MPTGDQETAEADSAHRRDSDPESTSDHSDQSATAEDEHPSSPGNAAEGDFLRIADEEEAACESERGEDNLGPYQGDGQAETVEDLGETRHGKTRGNFTPSPGNSRPKPPLVPHSTITTKNTGRRKDKVDSAPRHQRLRRVVRPPDRLIYSTSTHLLQGENSASETCVLSQHLLVFTWTKGLGLPLSIQA